MSGEDGFHLRVLKTDGDSLRKVMFINHPPPKGDIVFSWYHPELPDGHFTYHFDGYAHSRRSLAKNRPLVKGPPLDDFSGFFSPGQFQIHESRDRSFGDEYPPYEGDDHDEVVIVDTQLSDVAITVMPYLIESGASFSDVLTHPRVDGEPLDVRYFTITATEPWIVIAYWPIDFDEGFWLPPTSSNFDVLDSESGNPLPEQADII